MKRLDKSYWSAWVLLSVFIPMVLLSSLHVHPELFTGDIPCHECIDHTVHNGHITTVKATVDCPLCAFQSSVYDGGKETTLHIYRQVSHVVIECAVPTVTIGIHGITPGRAPPFTSCA